MADLGDLTAARNEAEKPAAELDTFTFYGERFHVADRVGEYALFNFGRMAASGADTDDGVEAYAAIAEVIDCCIYPPDLPRFRQHAIASAADTVDLLNVVKAILSSRAGRPTSLLSSSPDGQQPTTDTSRGVSSSQVTAQGAEYVVVPETRPDLAGLQPVDDAILASSSA